MHSIRFPRTTGFGNFDRDMHTTTDSDSQGAGQPRECLSFWNDPAAVKRIPLQEFDPFAQPLLIPQNYNKRRRHGFDAGLLGPGYGLAMPRPCRPHTKGEICMPESLSSKTRDPGDQRGANGFSEALTPEVKLSYHVTRSPAKLKAIDSTHKARQGQGSPSQSSAEPTSTSATARGPDHSRTLETNLRNHRTDYSFPTLPSAPPTPQGSGPSTFRVPLSEEFDTLARAVISLPETMQKFQAQWEKEMNELRYDRDILAARVDVLEREEESIDAHMKETFKSFAQQTSKKFDELGEEMKKAVAGGS